MRHSLLAIVGSLSLSFASVVQADTTIAYPTAEATSFTVTAPDAWKLTPAESDDDYFVLTGPTGAELYFRAMPGKIEDTIKENIDYLNENFTDVKLGDPTEEKQDGLPAMVAAGTGKAKEGGKEVLFAMAWIALPDGKIAEIWFNAGTSDEAGLKEAGAILDSFKAKK